MTTLAPAPAVPAQTSLGVTQLRVLRSEWTKFRSLRSTLVTLAAAIALTIGMGALLTGVTAAQWDRYSDVEKATTDLIGLSLGGFMFSQLALAVLAVLLWRRRPDALTGICLLWLVVYAFGVSFAVAYLVWALPFFIVRGHLVAVALVQLAFLPAQLILFNAPVDRTLALVAYTGVMVAGWLAAVAVLAVWARRLPRPA